MSIKFFGQFLIERGVITAEQLLQAVKLQEEKNLRFGDYARAKGYLSDGDLIRLQDEQRQTDMKIGELALSLGMLSQGQVDEILTMQENDHIFLGEALKRGGFISQEKLQAELDLFRQDQKDYVAEVINVPKGVRDAELVKAAVDITRKMFKRIARIEAKVGLGEAFNGEPRRNFATVKIGFTGSSKCDYIFSASREAAVALASGFTGEDVSGESDAMITDGVKEFCNISCGSVMARMAKKGKKVSITPPALATARGESYDLIGGRTAVRYLFITPMGEVSLILAEG